jgi:hypothetical protein
MTVGPGVFFVFAFLEHDQFVLFAYYLIQYSTYLCFELAFGWRFYGPTCPGSSFEFFFVCMMLYNKRTCRFGESGIGRTEGGWNHPRCVQSRTHRTCKYFWFLSHTPSHTHICSSSRYIRRCFVNIFQAKKIAGLLILLYLRLGYLYCIFLWFFFSLSRFNSHRKKFFKV